MWQIIIPILILIFIILYAIKEEDKKKKLIKIPILVLILICELMILFGFSSVPKFTYNMTNLFSNYEYKESFDIGNNLVLVISEKTSDDETDYKLSLQNKFIGLYINNRRKYSQGIMVNDDEKLNVDYIVYKNKYYYYFNSYKGIESICIDNELYDISNLHTYIYISDKRIESLEINSKIYNSLYHVQVKFN